MEESEQENERERSGDKPTLLLQRRCQGNNKWHPFAILNHLPYDKHNTNKNSF